MAHMSDAFDLDTYCARIGYRGDRAPTLSVLRELHALHPSAIAFENLNPLLALPVHLDLASLQAKLVRQRRGGYCFEQNTLFRAALESLGFKVTNLGARVLWNRPMDAVTARTHMLLLIELPEGPFIADVGFGGPTLTAPMRFAPDAVQTTPHEPFRLIAYRDAQIPHDEYVLQTCIRGEWRALYRFDLTPQHPVDQELTSWYLSHHPDSQFTKTLRVARTGPRRRYALLNNELTVHQLDAPSRTRILTSEAELRETLQSTFDIALPDSPMLSPTLARFIKP
jgi:N-hydroxyarylamine O-acetyltransferase